jgi:hypothetical protein
MTEQRGDAGAEAIAHDADAPAAAAHAAHAPVAPAEAGRPPGEHAPDDDRAHHAAAVDDHDDHAHMGEPLGPIDATAWAVGVLGVVLGLVVALCFAAAVGIG